MFEYDLLAYRKMVASRERMHAFAAALRAVIEPGATVIDIGTGTGACALLACRYGAGRVFAVEPDPAIEVARENAVRNGCADRIEFFPKTSQELTLEQRADVIVSDMRGVLPWFTGHIETIVDARTRLLKPDGVLVGVRDRLFAALVDSADTYEAHDGLVLDDAVDVGASRRYTTNSIRQVTLQPDALLSAPVQWSVLEYATVVNAAMHESFRIPVQRGGTAHGMIAWFDAELAEGVTLSNAPGAPPLVYGQMFFPFTDAVAVEPGDVVDVELRADLVAGDYVWTWNTGVTRAGVQLHAFRQSTFLSQPIPLDHLRRGAANHVPRRSADAEADLAVLLMMDGRTSLRDIARSLVDAMPARFATEAAALERVAELSRKYGG